MIKRCFGTSVQLPRNTTMYDGRSKRPCAKGHVFAHVTKKKTWIQRSRTGTGPLSHMQNKYIFQFNKNLIIITILQVSRCGILSKFGIRGGIPPRNKGNKELYPHSEGFTGLMAHTPPINRAHPWGSRHRRLAIRHEISLKRALLDFYSPRTTGRRKSGCHSCKLPARVYRFGN
jgi:hypothetical protein